MITLSYGYKKPATGDRGSVFFPALEDNITRLNSHNHDGSNSAALSTSSITNTTQSIDKANWASDANGLYKQTIAISGSLNWDEITVEFRKATTGEKLYLHALKASATSYDVYINDNTIDVLAIYS